MNQQNFMKKALDLAQKNKRTKHGAPFGAIVVKDGQVIGSGVNEVAVTNDLTNHAEIQAIRQASHALKTTNLEGCEIYASTEPCSMCLSAIYFSKIKTVYYLNASNPSQDYVYHQLALPHKERAIQMVHLEN
ncbi:nucleoside deaminase [Lysinibacillus cavernae]|uniref:nucleoside deaminase n=1 Tax=Lysinibacillus cavernae TaxID=2666135 RepID=UPI0012D8ABB9|nr:nucleoside deaminase [Lysinibacillus cavernae]